MTRLLARGLGVSSASVRMLRQCAELCELNVRALRKESRLARRTASLCFELSNQVACEAWRDAGDPGAHDLSRDALRLARSCRPLLFSY
ncbi:hypothetical protein [Myxococcus stipitatus]|uniref:hypothetical protein n=1 Tax=Myxococcus stipitatus TaxID=83455 RepID=UPI0030D53C5B